MVYNFSGCHNKTSGFIRLTLKFFAKPQKFRGIQYQILSNIEQLFTASLFDILEIQSVTTDSHPILHQ